MDKLAMVDREGVRGKGPAFTPRAAGGGRIRALGGVVTARKGGARRETFTVRRVSHGIGVERAFPLHSPRVERIDVVRPGEARRGQPLLPPGGGGGGGRGQGQRC